MRHRFCVTCSYLFTNSHLSSGGAPTPNVLCPVEKESSPDHVPAPAPNQCTEELNAKDYLLKLEIVTHTHARYTEEGESKAGDSYVVDCWFF